METTNNFRFRYRFNIRPISSFHIPSGVKLDPFSINTSDGMHGSACLNRKLTEQEADHFTLTYLGEEEPAERAR